MKDFGYLSFVLILAYALSACGATPAASASPTEPVKVEHQTGLIAALEAAGVPVEVHDPISQEFFGPEGQMLGIRDTDVQVFEYPSAEAMEHDAARVSPDGGSIGTTMVTWVDAPHFYKSGRIIVLYIGSDQTVMDLLEGILGLQFAGR